MLRIALALALGFGVVALSGVTTTAADKNEKKDDVKTVEGKLVCTKCKLSETDACGNAVQVKDGDKTVTYYLKDKGKDEKYHKCSGEQAVKVTGKITVKDDKKTIEDAKVEKQK